MDETLLHLGALKYCNSQDFRDLRWCKKFFLYIGRQGA